MTSSYSTDLKLELMVTGENAGTWGDKTNTNLNLLQQAIAGYQAVSVAGGAQTTALVMSNATISNARNAVVKLTGTITGNQIVTIPDGIEKTYIVENGTSGAFTVQFKTVSGTGPTFSTTDKGIKIVYSNGTDVVDVNANLSGPTLASDLDVNGKSIISTSNGNITLAPNGTGDVYLDADTVRIGDSNSNATLTTNGTGDLILNTNSGSNSGSITIADGTNGNISITPNGTGSIVLDGLNWPQADGSASQVLQTNGSGQLSFGTISSSPTQLVSSIPLASGGSVTAGRATFINSSGEVALYPTTNTLGTVYENTNATAYLAVSNNGSRAIKYSGTSTITITGVANSGTANAVDGATTVSNTNNNFVTVGVGAVPIGDDKFLVVHFRGNLTFQAPGGFNTQLFIVTVDASGNCTKGAVVTLTGSVGGGNPYASGTSLTKITDTLCLSGNGVSDTDGGTATANRALSISGTTITATTQTYTNGMENFVGSEYNSVFTTNNIVGVGTGSTFITAPYTTSIGTNTTTTVITDANTILGWYRITNSRVMCHYRDSNLLYKIKTFDVNQTTGALTLVDTEFLTGFSFAATASAFRFKDQNSGVFKFSSGGFYFANSISLDSSGNILGFNLGSNLGSTDMGWINYNTSNDFFYQYYTSTPKIVKYTVNAYATTTPNYLGIAKTTDSTTPVDIVTDGVASGFVGLTSGTLYYLSGNYDGTVTTDSATGILIGKAISATEILMQRSNTQ
jgi:hypothetical protein